MPYNTVRFELFSMCTMLDLPVDFEFCVCVCACVETYLYSKSCNNFNENHDALSFDSVKNEKWRKRRIETAGYELSNN